MANDFIIKKGLIIKNFQGDPWAIDIGDPNDTGYRFPSFAGTAGQVLSLDSNQDLQWVDMTTGGGGEANTGVNVGSAGVGVFKQKSGIALEFKNINAASSKVTVVEDAGNNEIDIDIVPGNINLSETNNDAGFITGINFLNEIGDVDVGTPGPLENGDALVWDNASGTFILSTIAVGENNTGQNVGIGGVGVFKQKSGILLQFKNINAGSSKVTVTDDTVNDEIDIDVDPSNIFLNDLGDVNVGTPGLAEDGDALVWDNTSGTFILSTITGGGVPGGSNTHIQYNDNGVFGGEATFTWDSANSEVMIEELLLRGNATEVSVYTANVTGGGDSEGIVITTGDADTGGTSGDLELYTGDVTGGGAIGGTIYAIAGSGVAEGGNLEFSAGDAETIAGTVSIVAGNSSEDNGGNVSITAGDGGPAESIVGGNITLTSGTADVKGGISLLTPSSNDKPGEGIVLRTGDATTRDTAEIALRTGNSTSGTSGSILFIIGSGGTASGDLIFDYVGGPTYTWPNTDGTNNQVLTTNGSGDLFWSTPAGGGTPGGSNTQIQYNNSGSFAGDTGFTTDGAGSVAITGDLTVDDLSFDGNTITGVGPTNGDIVLDPAGAGLVVATSGYDMSSGPDHAFATKGYVDDKSNLVTDINNEINIGNIIHTGKLNETLLDNVTNASSSILYDATYRSAIVEYGIQRGAVWRTGTLHIINDGTTVSVSDSGADIGTIGVSFSAQVILGNVEIQYTTTNTGINATMYYTMRRFTFS